jgi:PAS domain S-box-containing protein
MESIGRGDNLANCFTLLSDAVMALMSDWAEDYARINLTEIKDYYQGESVDDAAIKPEYMGESFELQIAKHLYESGVSLNRYLTEVHEFSSAGGIAQIKFPDLFRELVDFRLCKDGWRMGPRPMSFENSYTYMLMMGQLLNGENKTEWFYTDNTFCSFVGNLINFGAILLMLRNGDGQEEVEAFENVKSKLNVLLIVVPLVFGLIIVLPMPIVAFLVFRELKTLCTMLKSFDDNIRKEAAAPIRLDLQDDPDFQKSETRREVRDLGMIIVIVAVMLLGCLQAVMVLHLLLQVRSHNDDYLTINTWKLLGSLQIPRISEVVVCVMQIIFLQDPLLDTGKVTTIEEQIIRAINIMDQMADDLTALIRGDRARSVIGVDPDIDNMFMSEQCQVEGEPEEGLHDYYRCGSLNHLASLMDISVSNVIDLQMTYTGGMVKDKLPLEVWHLAASHLVPMLRRFDRKLQPLTEMLSKKYIKSLVIDLVVGLVVGLAIVVILHSFKVMADNSISGAMILLRRVPPSAIVANGKMLDYLLNRDLKDSEMMSTTRSVVHNAQNAIVCCSKVGIIDSINLMVTYVLGFTPEQLLGQSIEIIFEKESGKSLRDRMNLMIRNECAKTFESVVTCVTDEEKKVSCHVTMMGIANRDGISSFVFILKDVTLLLEQQKAAEEAKARSEELLYQILPRDIVNKLNEGEKDISFLVDSATLMFIDIQKFSEYAANLTPQQIMGNL